MRQDEHNAQVRLFAWAERERIDCAISASREMRQAVKQMRVM